MEGGRERMGEGGKESGSYHFYDKIQASACTTFW
jgi:hypothetical protein